MSGAVEPLVTAKVIGDVVDHFTPMAELTVQYGEQTVTNGCELKPSEAKQKPHVKITSHNLKPDNLYTLVCFTFKFSFKIILVSLAHFNSKIYLCGFSANGRPGCSKSYQTDSEGMDSLVHNPSVISIDQTSICFHVL